jgi:hypothetical protein
MKPAPNIRHATYTSAAEILLKAHFTEDPKRLDIASLTPEQQATVVASALHGFRPIRVIWPDGATALMPLAPGASLPDPNEVVTAYRGCNAMLATQQKGDRHE